VARADKELERDAIVVSRRRTGTVVADQPPRATTDDVRMARQEAAQRFVLEIRRLGAEPDETIARCSCSSTR